MFGTVNMNAAEIIKIVAFSVVIISCHTSLRYCHDGSYEFKPPVAGKEVCIPCPSGTFMPHYDHRYKECFKCTSLEDPELEILVSACTENKDAVIVCRNGFYRRLPRNPREKAVCLKCSECRYPDYEVKTCGNYTDTGCCPGENFDTYVNDDGVGLCRERDWLCRKGHYYDTASALCLFCPSGTFMSQDYHSNRKCWECQKPLGPLNSVILQQCNSTHPLVIGCKEGYFMNSSMGYRNNRIGCSLCTRCNTTDKPHEVRKCDQFHDTVCCPQADMMVVENADGLKCMQNEQTTLVPTLTRCGQDQYLFVNFGDITTSCVACAEGTYMNETNHSYTACKKCTEYTGKDVPSVCGANETDGDHRDREQAKSTDDFMAVLVVFVVLFVLSLFCNIILLYQVKRRRKKLKFYNVNKYVTSPADVSANPHNKCDEWNTFMPVTPHNQKVVDGAETDAQDTLLS